MSASTVVTIRFVGDCDSNEIRCSNAVRRKPKATPAPATFSVLSIIERSASTHRFTVLIRLTLRLTQRWYVREDALGNVVETQANPAILNVGLAISLVLAVGANVALIFRFTEKKPRLATLISIACLLVHDVINIVTVAIFGVVHAVDDGFVRFPLSSFDILAS